MSRITHSLRRPIYLIPSTVAVVAVIALTLFPWKVDQPGGYHVAFAGVDKDLALQKYGVQRVLQRLGISDADVEVGDCEASCNLVIRELRDEAEVGKVVSAMFQLSDCELLEVSRDGEVCLNIPGQKSITFDGNGNAICDFTSDLSDEDRVLVEIAVREVCFSAGDGGELNLNDCLSAKTVNITNCTIPCGPPQNLEGWSDEAAARGDTLKLTLSVCGKPGIQEIGGTGVYVGDLPAIASSDPAPSQDKSSASINGFQLSQNYPNPFNAATTIIYNVPENGGNVTLEIYNINGQLVRTLVNRHESAGSHEITWDATDSHGNSVASGMYLYRLTAGSYVETRKMSLLK